MTQPPEVHLEPRTDQQRTEDDIVTACRTIRHSWGQMIAPDETQAPGIVNRVGVVLDDHDPRESDTRRIDRVLSHRRYVMDVLHSWCRVVIEDQNIDDPQVTCLHGILARVTLRHPNVGPLAKPFVWCRAGLPLNGRTHTLLGTDVAAMSQFIETHAQWLSAHDAAGDARDELGSLARKVTAIVTPPTKEWISLGSCPLEVEFDPAAGVQVCQGQVRAWPRAVADPTRAERAGEKLPTCRRCGTEASVEWWYSHMFSGDAGVSHLVTVDELIGVIAVRLDWVVTHGQVRQWKHRGKIESEGKDSKGRTLYRHDAVVNAIREDVQVQREKVAR